MDRSRGEKFDFTDVCTHDREISMSFESLALSTGENIVDLLRFHDCPLHLNRLPNRLQRKGFLFLDPGAETMDNRGSRIVERGVKYIYDEKKEERERKDRSVDRSAFFLADGNEIRDREREEEGCSSWKQLPDTRNEHVM